MITMKSFKHFRAKAATSTEISSELKSNFEIVFNLKTRKGPRKPEKTSNL